MIYSCLGSTLDLDCSLLADHYLFGFVFSSCGSWPEVLKVSRSAFGLLNMVYDAGIKSCTKKESFSALMHNEA